VTLLLPAPPGALADYEALLETWATQAITVIQNAATAAAKAALCSLLNASAVIDAIAAVVSLPNAVLVALTTLAEVLIVEIRSAVGC
jgi:hypothetical protein